MTKYNGPSDGPAIDGLGVPLLNAVRRLGVAAYPTHISEPLTANGAQFFQTSNANGTDTAGSDIPTYVEGKLYRVSETPDNYRRVNGGFELKELDADQGLVTAYVNTLEAVDYDGEVIDSGAYDESIAKGNQAVCWFHDWRCVYGKVVAAAEVDGRLLCTMQFDTDDPAAMVAFGKVKKGLVSEWSVGFFIKEFKYVREPGKEYPIRHITNLDWVEVSPVLRGASPNTETIAAKTRVDVVPATDNVAAPDEVTDTTPTDVDDVTEIDAEAMEAAKARLAAFVEVEPEAADTDAVDSAEARLKAFDLIGKVGARNSAADQKAIQAAHDTLVALGATCSSEESE